MAMPIHSDIDLNGNQILNFRCHVSATAPSTNSGMMWYDTAATKFKYYNGTKWVAVNLEDVSVSAPLTVSKTNPQIPVIGISAATTSAAGSMSAEDKIKLDGATSSNTASTLVLRDASGNASFGTVSANKVVSSSQASASTEVPNLQQVQSLLAGHGNFITVRAVAIANIAYGGTAPSTLDGVALAVNDMVLLTAQTTATQNGIYIVTTVGTGSNGTWTRVADNSTPHFVTQAGLRVTVAEGTSYADTEWLLTTNNPITVGTTSLQFVQQDGAAKILAGTALAKSGNTFNVQVDNTTVQVNGNKIEIKPPYRQWQASGTITGTGAATTFNFTVPSVTTLLSVRVENSSGREIIVENYLLNATTVTILFGLAPANGVTYHVKILAV